MGCFKPFSSSSYDKPVEKIRVIERTIEKPVYIEKKLPNPDPFNYIVKRHCYIGRFLLMDVIYPDCDNFEGRKFMVYDNVLIDDLKRQVSLDPHFSSNKKFHSPIARFEPTPEGWEMALKFVRFTSKCDDEDILNDGWRN